MRTLKSLDGHATSLYRAVLGLLFSCHGAATLFGVFGGAFGSGGSISALHWPDGTAALIELVGGALVLIGLATRPIAVLCSGVMAYAYFTVHVGHGLFPIENGGELAALFCWGFLMVAIIGPGPLSLDAVIGRVRGTLPEKTGGLRAEAQES
jgi:putative oxidoreductase